MSQFVQQQTPSCASQFAQKQPFLGAARANQVWIALSGGNGLRCKRASSGKPAADSGLCSSAQTAPCASVSICSALLFPGLFESVGNQKESNMYIGGGMILLLIVLFLVLR
jgi:hypothetical protein